MRSNLYVGVFLKTKQIRIKQTNERHVIFQILLRTHSAWVMHSLLSSKTCLLTSDHSEPKAAGSHVWKFGGLAILNYKQLNGASHKINKMYLKLAWKYLSEWPYKSSWLDLIRSWEINVSQTQKSTIRLSYSSLWFICLHN